MGLFSRNNNSGSNDFDSDTANKSKNGEEESSNFFKRIMKMRINSHRRIERKATLLITLIGILLISVVIGYFHGRDYENKQAHVVTGAGTSVDFSKTDASLKLGNLVKSDDNKNVYIPFRLSNISALPTNANNYKVFITPTIDHLDYKPTGQLVMFGTTGRGVLILHNNKPIPNQPINVIIRNNKQLSKATSDKDDDAMDTGTKTAIGMIRKSVDVVNFKINPGSPKIKVDKSLGKDDSLTSMYHTLYSKSEIKRVQSANAKDLKDIGYEKTKADEYKKRLQIQGYEVPDSPKYVEDNWRPFDAIGTDGIPANLKGKENKKEAANKAYKPVDVSDDSNPDKVQFPSSLKNKNGGNTSDTSGSDDGANSPTTSSGDDGTTTQDGDNGTTVNMPTSGESPATTWSNLQNSWTKILQLKRDVYVTNAQVEYQINYITKTQNKLGSIGNRRNVKLLPNTVYSGDTN